ncbi:Uncharacterised protein [Mycobacterium tuberculosis]|nr:Uncharacterised protein [Mycobacterium tuberculosis]
MPSSPTSTCPGSRVSDTSIQCRTFCACSSGTPNIVVITSTGNGPENSCTASKPSGLTLLRYLSTFSTTMSRWDWMARGVKTLLSRLRMWRWSGGSMKMIDCGGRCPERTIDRSMP